VASLAASGHYNWRCKTRQSTLLRDDFPKNLLRRDPFPPYHRDPRFPVRSLCARSHRLGAVRLKGYGRVPTLLMRPPAIHLRVRVVARGQARHAFSADRDTTLLLRDIQRMPGPGRYRCQSIRPSDGKVETAPRLVASAVSNLSRDSDRQYDASQFESNIECRSGASKLSQPSHDSLRPFGHESQQRLVNHLVV
jgi:hypothetical protein